MATLKHFSLTNFIWLYQVSLASAHLWHTVILELTNSMSILIYSFFLRIFKQPLEIIYHLLYFLLQIKICLLPKLIKLIKQPSTKILTNYKRNGKKQDNELIKQKYKNVNPKYYMSNYHIPISLNMIFSYQRRVSKNKQTT